jgi:hypothetical protein
LCQAQFARPWKGEREQLKGDPDRGLAVIAVDHPKQRAELGRVGDRGMVSRLGREKGALERRCRVRLDRLLDDGQSEDCREDAAHAPGGLAIAFGLHDPQDAQHVAWLDVGDVHLP